MKGSKIIQIDHRVQIQKSAMIIQTGSDSYSNSSSDNDSNSDFREKTSFYLRTGEKFSVETKELLQIRQIDLDAVSREMEYLEEVVCREFVYNGVMVQPLTLRQEVALLFYLADAIELTGNALAIQEGEKRITDSLINHAICEVDASILGTASALGATVLKDESFGF